MKIIKHVELGCLKTMGQLKVKKSVCLHPQKKAIPPILDSPVFMSVHNKIKIG